MVDKIIRVFILNFTILILVACATKAPNNPNDYKVNIIEIELGHWKVSRESVARQITWRAKNCWIGKIQSFEGFEVSEPKELQPSGDILELWEVVLTNPSVDPYRIQTMDLNVRGQRGYMVRAFHKTHHQNIHSVVKKAVREIEAGGLGC